MAHLPGSQAPPSDALRDGQNSLSSYSWLTCAPTVTTSAPARSLREHVLAGAPQAKHRIFTLRGQDDPNGRVAYQPDWMRSLLLLR